jgi:hypothetical protein
VNTTSPPSIREFARRLLYSEETTRPGDGEAALVFQRGCQSLHAALAPLITSAAFEALLRRAAHVAGREFPALDGVTSDAIAQCSLGPLPETVSGQTAHPAGDALALVLANLLWLLVTLLGTHLTVRAVKAAWPEVSTNEARSILHEGIRDD